MTCVLAMLLVIRKELNKSQADEPNKNLQHQHSHSDKNEDRLLARKLDNGESYLPFVYECNQKLYVFICMSKDYTLQCPMCLNETKYIIQHLSKSKNCKIPGDLATFRDQFGLYKEKFKKEQNRKHQKAFIARKRVEDEAKIKEQNRKCQEVSMARKREEEKRVWLI